MVAVPSIGRADRQQPARTAPEAEVTRRLYEQYARQIYAYCLQQLRSKEEAEDATQSTFLNAFRGLQRGIDPEFESAWLYKIAQNVCLTRQRSSTRRRRVESPGDLDAIQDALPAREVPADELIGLPEALQGMPEQQRRALLLREWQGLSYREIAEELDLSQAAVETLIFRARRTLAGGLSEPSARGGDAGSLVAILKSLLFTGGTKVAATVATVAATSVVAATPTARHAVEHAVVNLHPPAAKPAHVASHRSATAVAKPKPVVAHPSTAAAAESAGATVRKPVAKRRHARHPAVHRASAVQRALPGHVPADPAPVAPVVPAAAAPAPPTVTATTATTTTPAAAPAPAPAPAATPSPAPTVPQPTAPTATRKGSDPGKRTGGGTVAAPVVTVPVATAPVTTAPVASAPAPAPPRHPRGREIHGPWAPVPVDTTPTATTPTPTPSAPPVTTAPVTTTPATTTPAPPVTTTPAPPPVPAPPVPGPPRVRVGIGFGIGH